MAFFVWTPRFLLHNRLSVIDVLPGAILVTVGLLVLRLVSQIVLRNWLDWYSTYYGALGVIMAIFFWLLIAATILAHRPWRHRTPAGGPADPPKRVNRHPS